MYGSEGGVGGVQAPLSIRARDVLKRVRAGRAVGAKGSKVGVPVVERGRVEEGVGGRDGVGQGHELGACPDTN